MLAFDASGRAALFLFCRPARGADMGGLRDHRASSEAGRRSMEEPSAKRHRVRRPFNSPPCHCVCSTPPAYLLFLPALLLEEKRNLDMLRAPRCRRSPRAASSPTANQRTRRSSRAPPLSCPLTKTHTPTHMRCAWKSDFECVRECRLDGTLHFAQTLLQSCNLHVCRVHMVSFRDRKHAKMTDVRRAHPCR